MGSGTSFSKVLTDLMVESGFSSPQRFYDFLGGERALGVSSVYFANWAKSAGLPRPDKLESLINSLSKASNRAALLRAYMSDLFHGQETLTSLLSEEMQKVTEKPADLPKAANSKYEAAPFEITMPQLSFLATNIDHYRVFSVLLIRSVVQKPTSSALLIDQLQLSQQFVEDVLHSLSRFDLVVRKSGLYKLASTKIVWPRSADAKPALLLLNDYDRQIFAVMNHRVRNRSLTTVLRSDRVEKMEAEIRAIENKYYLEEGECIDPKIASVVYYHSSCYASKNWIEADV